MSLAAGDCFAQPGVGELTIAFATERTQPAGATAIEHALAPTGEIIGVAVSEALRHERSTWLGLD